MKPLTTSFCQIGIWRSTSGTPLAGCSIVSVWRTLPSALSILLRNRMRGMPLSSRFLRMTWSAGIFFSSASATTTARSTPASTGSASKANSIEPGQSMNVMRSPMKSVSATLTSTLIWWARASGEASPTVLPSPVVPWRVTAPVRARIASSSEVLPLANGPTSAMHRGPAILPPFVPFVDMALPPHGCFCQPQSRRPAVPMIVSGNRRHDKGARNARPCLSTARRAEAR